MAEVYCGSEPCPLFLNSTCVFYTGESLLYIGVQTNDTLEAIIVKINQAFQNTGIGYAFTNGVIQPTPSQPVQLGGALIQNTTIGGNFTLTFSGNVQAAKHITTGGSSSQFVKGDGTLDSTAYQPAANYITGLSGDVLASGPGVAAATLATVNFSSGTFGNGNTIPIVTVNSKGLVTNITPIPVTIPPLPITFIGDVVGSGSTGSNITLLLQNVNPNIYNTITPLKFSVNGKGLVTSASPITASDIVNILGFNPSGTAGSSGTSGTTGTSGTSGTSGIDGTFGTSGTSGTSGSSATSGTSGTSGSSGTAGTSGSTGTSGSSGTTGTSGSSGTTGTSGSSGTSGTTGTSGSSGTSGTTGTSGSSGLSGDRFKTTSTTTYTLQAPGNPGTLTVDPGLSYTVAQSIIIAFDANNHNEAEVTSYNPLTGVINFVTFTLTGSGTYSSWFVNIDGASGGDGSSGTSGTTGTSGSSGTSGTTGTSGSSGTSGTTGTSGSSGTSGTSATDGTGGTSGTSGSSATSGTSGTSGTSATSGTSGTSGSTPVNQVTGSGTTNYLPKFTGSTTIGDSQIFDNGTNVGINTNNPLSTNLLGALTIVKSYSSDTPASTTAQTYYTNQSGLYLFGRNSGLTIVGANNEENQIIFANTSTVAFASINTGTGSNSTGGDMYFKVGSNTEAMRIFATTRNVHIGPTPVSDNGARLQVSGTATINGAANTTTFNVKGSGANGILLDENAADATSSTRIFFKMNSQTYAMLADTNGLNFMTGAGAGSTSGTPRVTLTSGGNVGIGTASPAGNLQVASSSSPVIAMNLIGSATSGPRGDLAWYNSSISTVALIRATAVTDNVGTQLEFYTRPVAGSLTQVMTLASTGAATFNLGSGEMRLNRTGTSEFLKLNTYYILSDGNDQLLGSVTGATSIYAGNGVSPRLTITSSGNVGIGVTPNSWGSSFKPLQMGSYGSFIAGRTDDNSMFIGKNVYFDGSNWIGTTTGWSQQIVFDSSGNTFFRNANVTANTVTGFNNQLYLASSGNVGIGTGFTPSYPLHVYVSVADWGAVVQNLNASSYGMYVRGGATNGSTSAFYVANTASTMLLDIKGSGAASFNGPGGRIVRIDGPSNTDNYLSLHSGTIEMFIDADFTNSSGIVGTQSSHNLILRTAGTNKVWVTPGGNVLIGTGTDNGDRMNISGAVSISSNLGVGRGSESGVRLSISGAGTSSAAYGIITRDSLGNDLFYVRNDGYTNFGTRANSPYNYNVTFSPRTAGLDAAGGIGYVVSTRESKGNIEPVKNIDFIKKLNPVSFNYRKKNIDNTEFINELYEDIYYGFIADEVEKVNKELVFYNQDGTLSGVEYNSMIAILTKAVQELQAKLDKNNIN